MKKVVIVVVVVVGLLMALLGIGYWLDRKAEQLAEAEAGRRVVEVLPHTRLAVVDIDSFPFLADVLWTGKVERLHVTLHDVAEAGVTVELVELDVDAISIDKDLLIEHQKLAVTDIGRASLSVVFTDQAISKVLGHTIRFEGTVAKVETPMGPYAAEISIAGRRVVVRVDGPPLPAQYAALTRPLVFDMPSADVLPCTPTVAVSGSRLRLGCALDKLPDAVKRALAQR